VVLMPDVDAYYCEFLERTWLDKVVGRATRT